VLHLQCVYPLGELKGPDDCDLTMIALVLDREVQSNFKLCEPGYLAKAKMDVAAHAQMCSIRTGSKKMTFSSLECSATTTQFGNTSEITTNMYILIPQLILRKTEKRKVL
jgi:hypothetical protein